jgi:hypothetical protein
MNAFIMLAADVLLAGLLAVTIYYCIRLNRHVQAIRDSKSELSLLIQQFSEATLQAQASVDELRQSSKKVVDTLATRIEKGNYLADDLSFMIEKATKLADQLERGIAGTKQTPATAGAPVRTAVPATPAAKEPVAAEPKINPKAVKAEPAPASPPVAAKPAEKRGLEAIARKAEPAANPDKPASKAEKELLEMLKAIR